MAFPLKVGGAGKSRPSHLQGKSLGNEVDSRVQKLMCWPVVEGTRVKISFYRFQFDASQPLYKLKRHHFLEVCYGVLAVRARATMRTCSCAGVILPSPRNSHPQSLRFRERQLRVAQPRSQGP